MGKKPAKCMLIYAKNIKNQAMLKLLATAQALVQAQQNITGWVTKSVY